MFDEQTALSNLNKELRSVIEAAREAVVTLRTGRASPALVEKLTVLAYGGQSKLKLMELATITTEGSSGLRITPFDPSTIGDIEQAILSSSLNLTPRVDESTIHIKIPPLSEEQRTQLVRIVSQKVEEGRVHLRSIRDNIRKKIRNAFSDKQISEDQKFRIEKEIEKIVKEFVEQLDIIKDKKEKEILEV